MASTLDNIYSRLNGVSAYHPMSSTTFADWSLEAGDIVKVSRDGTSYQSPVSTTKLKWNGKQQITINTDGSKERDAVSKVSAKKYATGGGGGSGMRSSQKLYWEMFSEDGTLHATIHATAESLTSDYTKKIGATNTELRGVITQTAESLTSDYTKKIGDTNTELRGVITQTAESLTSDYTKKIGDQDAALRGVIRQTAESLTSDYNSKIDATESHIEQTAGQIRTSVSNLDDRLSTQIAQTDSRVGMSVGHVKYTSVVHKANKSAFPSPGKAGTLYYADDTGKAYLYMPGTHSYELAQTDEYGNANYIKAGEIAISINESGQTEAKLDADRVLAGKGALTIDDLELPDWMDTTTGLIAEKATIVQLNALKARVGTLEADSITTANLASKIANLDGVTMKVLTVNSVEIPAGEGNQLKARAVINAYGGIQDSNGHVYNVYDASVNAAGTELTIYKLDGNHVTFRKATSLSGAWSSGTFTVTAGSGTTPVSTTLADDITKSGDPVQCTASGTPSTTGKYMKQNIIINYVKDSENHPSTGKKINVVIAASKVYEAGEKSVDVDTWTQNGDVMTVKLSNDKTDSQYISNYHGTAWNLTCTKRTPEGGGDFSYTFEATLRTSEFVVGTDYNFYR